MMLKNHKSNGKTAQRNGTPVLTAHRWEDGHEFIVYLEADAKGIFREVAAVPVEQAESRTLHPAALASTAKPAQSRV
jgi:hypothetical protein